MPIHRTTAPASAVTDHPSVEDASPALDLQPFCGTDELHPYLLKPFSRNGFTYAANGHIMVRVALRPDVPDVDKKFNPDAPFKGLEEATFFRPSFQLPPAPTERGHCTACDGRGWEHDCPDCECVCDACKGSGDIDPEQQMSTSIGATPFNMNYVRQMLSLPGIEIETLPAKISEKPLLFRFEGGVGALMPLRRDREEHVDIALSANG